MPPSHAAPDAQLIGTPPPLHNPVEPDLHNLLSAGDVNSPPSWAW